MKKFFLTLTVVAAFAVVGLAQPLPSHNGDGGEVPHDAPIAPIGSGIAILMVLGAGYGTKKVYDHRKKLI